MKRLPLLASLLGVALFAGAVPGTPQDNKAAPLSLQREGYLFAGGKYSAVDGQQVMSGQLYAEFQIPAHQTHRFPVVMIHGGGQSGTNFTQTPDGREGWAEFFLRKGYAVYVVDQPGRGKAAYQSELYGPLVKPDVKNIEQRFTAAEKFNLWPQAHLHTQWPGTGLAGDPVFDQFYASQLPGIADFALVQSLNRDGLVALLEKIGPAILLTHSQSGPFGWLVADARPDLVKAILAVEPNGPPFYDLQLVGAPDWFHYGTKIRPWGATAVPLHYSPAAANADDLAIVQQEQSDAPEFARCWLQKEPARQLPNLQKMPILLLTSESSFRAVDDHCTAKYLNQAGVHPTWTKLAEIGIHGNGHMMMLEKNNLAIAEVMSRWLEKALP
ncbi:MAG TPA: alpha/beta hydrolase [Candidatus Acidoferrales bacterium]|nr:alpha/beta hydrolase [Candidatus Acidoferrales bacterium]